MVDGIEKFKKKFERFPDCYTVIGGAACEILMKEADTNFRATKDIDMILLLEDKYVKFAKEFWSFILEGGYKCGWKNSNDLHFYRFTEPKKGYPYMIELFSRKPNYHLEVRNNIIPIHIDEEVSSLSAILLNDDFYNFMLEGRRTVAGVSVLGAEHLIPFKMFAWIDLLNRKKNKEHVNEKDLKKHKNDVFRLIQIVNPDKKIQTRGLVKENINMFLQEIRKENIRLETLKLPFSFDDAIAILEDMYM